MDADRASHPEDKSRVGHEIDSDLAELSGLVEEKAGPGIHEGN